MYPIVAAIYSYSPTYFKLTVMAGGLLTALLVLGVIVALLINRKTRWWTVGLMCLGIGCLLVLGVAFVGMRVQTPTDWRDVAMSEARRARSEAQRLQPPTEVPADRPSDPYAEAIEYYSRPDRPATVPIPRPKSEPRPSGSGGGAMEQSAASTPLPDGRGSDVSASSPASNESKPDLPKKDAKAAEAVDEPAEPDEDDDLSDAEVQGIVKKLVRAVSTALPNEADRQTAIKAFWQVLAQAVAEQRKQDAKSRPVATKTPATAVALASARNTDTSDEHVPAPRPAIAGRPAWVDAPSGKVDDAYQMVTSVGPYTTRMECDRALRAQLDRAVTDYVDLYLGARATRQALFVPLSDEYIEANVVKATWEETKETSVGPMKELHVLLEFDRKTNDLLKQRWHDAQVQERLIVIGACLGTLLLALLVVFIVLKFDVVTRGAWRQHMLLGIGTVVLGAIGAGVLLAAPRDDDAGILCVFIGLPVLVGSLAMTLFRTTRRFGLALLCALALASVALLKFLNC